MASVETHSFSSTLSVYVRAGSRQETYSQQGLTHLLKNTAFLVCAVCVCECVMCVCGDRVLGAGVHSEFSGRWTTLEAPSGTVTH